MVSFSSFMILYYIVFVLAYYTEDLYRVELLIALFHE